MRSYGFESRSGHDITYATYLFGSSDGCVGDASEKHKITIMDRRTFLNVASAATASLAVAGETVAAPLRTQPDNQANTGILVRFLGTGAADWNGTDERGECRRHSSVLIDHSVLIDFTEQGFDILPQTCHPEVLFYTHSHGDHYNPEAALRVGVKRVYTHQSWFDRATAEFDAAAKKTGLPLPDIIPLCIAQTITECGLSFTPLPANHATSFVLEQSVIYLVQKGSVRLLYATDTAGLPGVATRSAGIDFHNPASKPITALIMEATMGLDHEVDPRYFAHSSVATVEKTVKALTMTNRYTPPQGQHVYLTHMARTLFDTHKETEEALPHPLCPAYDGLEVVFR